MTARPHGIAAVTGCRPCWAAARLGRGSEYEPGRLVGAVHARHIPELQAAGWVIRPLYDDDADDVLCPHVAATLDA